MSALNSSRFLRGLCAGAGSLALLALAACSSTPDKPKPGPLETISAPQPVALRWSIRLASIPAPLALAPAAATLTIADTDGTVVSVRQDTGAEVWRAAVGARLNAGAGSDGRFAGVVTRGNELVVFDAGQVKWRQQLPTRVATAPLVAGERVFVVGVDRVVRAFDALDGRRLWTQSRPGDALSLSQAGVLMPFKDTLLAGQGARLAGLDPLQGSVRWDSAIASPRGTNEVERLADLVAPAARVGDVVCARAFQAAVSCVDAARGTNLWTRTGGGTDGVAADDQFVYGADASDRVTAWRRSNGEVAWTSDRLLYRGLSAPAVVGSMVAFGDSQGMVHFLSRETGLTVQRLATDGSPIQSAPVAAGNLLFVATRNGGVYAFQPG